MSTSMRPTAVFNAVKTRELVLQNPDGTFPAVNTVLALDDSNGTVAPTADLSLDSINVNNNNLVITSSGHITAKTITLTTRDTAITTTGGDMILNNANLTVTGNQQSTGYVTCASLQLNDLSNSQAATYLWVNDQNLLWQSESLGQTLNISQNVLRLGVDPTGADIVAPTGPSDNVGMFNALTTLLEIFNKNSMFIGIHGQQPTPPPPPPPPGAVQNTVYFNAPCSMAIRIYPISSPPPNGTPITDVFHVYPGSPTASSVTTLLTNLCTNLNSTLNSQDHRLDSYITFSYSDLGGGNFRIRMEFNPSIFACAVYFADNDRVGESRRFLNQLQLGTISGITAYDPSFSGQLVYREDLVTYANPVLTTASFSKTLSGTATYFNNDKAVAAPDFTVTAGSAAATFVVTIARQPSVTYLHDNSIQAYGVTFNGNPIFMAAAPTTGAAGYPFTFTVSYLGFPNTVTNNRIAIVTIDKYNQSVTAKTVLWP